MAEKSREISNDEINEAVQLLNKFLGEKGLLENFKISQISFTEKHGAQQDALLEMHSYRYEKICHWKEINGEWAYVCEYSYINK